MLFQLNIKRFNTLNMKLIYLVLTICFLQSNLFGQKELAKAYINLMKGDKLEGYVEVINDIENEAKIKFYKTKDSKAKTYKSKFVKSYSFEDSHEDEVGNVYKYWRHYKQMTMERPPRVLATAETLVEKVADGHIVLYKYLYDTPADTEMPESTLYIVKREGKKEKRISPDNFKLEVKKLFADYTALVNQLGKKKFKFANLKRMVDDYNYWKQNNHEATVYMMNPKIFMDMID